MLVQGGLNFQGSTSPSGYASMSSHQDMPIMLYVPTIGRGTSALTIMGISFVGRGGCGAPVAVGRTEE